MSPGLSSLPPRPSRALGLAVSAALVVVWGLIRLVVFDTTLFPLTYALPLLVGVWTRDRAAVWGMAAIFLVFHAVKLFWILPPGMLARDELWGNYGATVANVLVSAVAVQMIIALRERLEAALANEYAQSEELRAQGEELAQQNEELAHQTEELSQQGEELASQNEELQAQSEDITALNDVLARRERLLETLLDMARLSPGEQVAVDHLARVALDLFGEEVAAAAVFERTASGLVRRAGAARPEAGADLAGLQVEPFVEIALAQQRPTAVDDVTLRPDLFAAPAGAVLCMPIRLTGDITAGLLVVARRPRAWTEEDFRLAEWLGNQAGRLLLALRLQATLREADQRKGEFLATLSHELRNPLAPIRFALRLLEEGRGDEAGAVAVLQRQVRQLARLIDDLLDATRLSSNKIQVRLQPVDLHGVVRHVLDGCRPDVDAAGHALVVDLAPAPVWVQGDPERLSQVVINLVNNAVRYTPAGGRITVTLAAAGAEALLSVADTGIGLDCDDLDRVFEMFTQVGGPGSGGLGIGLALVRGIVERHGGRVRAVSRGLGHGCEFLVALPLAAEAMQGATAIDAPAAAGASTRVLIVDDNVDAAEMLAALLAAHGHDVRTAHRGEAALATAGTFRPEVALLDIGLPDIDGYELARRLRGVAGADPLHLVALTGWGQDGDRARALAAGFDRHLTKPTEPELVLAAVATARPAAREKA
jgi:signal transduction histidine kinase/ActR/RegA family two-component response regulator